MAGQLVNRGKNVWLCRVYMGRDASGKRDYMNHTVHGTKEDAQKWLNKTLRDRDLGYAVRPAHGSVSEFLTQWLETVAKRKVKEKTYGGYSDILKNRICPALGNRALAKLTPMDVQGVYNGMAEEGLSPRTIQYTNMILKQSLKQAVVWRMIQFNPCDGVEVPRQVRREMQVFSAEQTRRFLAVARLEQRWGPLFSVAITTGMRPSEYLALKWPDLDLERRTVSIQRSIDFKQDGTYTFSDNKTGRSRRPIKLHSDVTELLREHRAAQAQDGDLVFCTSLGTPIERRNVRRALRRIIRVVNNSTEDPKQKLPVLRLYDLRHTAATLALAAGVPVKVVSEMLGHASAALTLDIYSHVLPHMQDEAVDRVEALLRLPATAPTKGDPHTIGTQAPNGGTGRVS